MPSQKNEALYLKKHEEMRGIIKSLAEKFMKVDKNAELIVLEDPLEEGCDKELIKGTFPFEYQITFTDLFHLTIIFNQSLNTDDSEQDIQDFLSVFPFLDELKTNELIEAIYIKSRNEMFISKYFYQSDDEKKNNKIMELKEKLSSVMQRRQERIIKNLKVKASSSLGSDLGDLFNKTLVRALEESINEDEDEYQKENENDDEKDGFLEFLKFMKKTVGIDLSPTGEEFDANSEKCKACPFFNDCKKSKEENNNEE